MQETSLKGLIQGLSPEQPGVIEGKVTSTSPLSVTIVNDTKMCLSANSLVVPQHLTSYTVKIGDVVYLLHYNSGKKFYILDRKGE